MEKLLLELCRNLENRAIEYMLSGSLAMSFYTIPRLTRDIDIVVQLQSGDIDRFLSIFQHHYYHRQSIGEEISRKGMFNVIDNETGFKIDFIIRKDSSYGQTAFGRRLRLDDFGEEVWVIAIEDLILAKLIWIQEIFSDRQTNDIRNLLKNPEIDRQYLDNWVFELKLNVFDLL